MSEIAIKVEHLSKRYRIGLKEQIQDTLTGAIKDVVMSPFKRFRNLASLSTFDTQNQDEAKD